MQIKVYARHMALIRISDGDNNMNYKGYKLRGELPRKLSQKAKKYARRKAGPIEPLVNRKIVEDLRTS
jgi:hypothetical protein